HLQAHLARLRCDAPETAAAAERALAYLPRHETALRAGSLLALGAGQLLAGDLAAAEATLTTAYDQCREHNTLGMLVALRSLGDLAAQQGRLRAAAERYQEVLLTVGARDLWERWEAEIGLGDL